MKRPCGLSMNKIEKRYETKPLQRPKKCYPDSPEYDCDEEIMCPYCLAYKAEEYEGELNQDGYPYDGAEEEDEYWETTGEPRQYPPYEMDKCVTFDKIVPLKNTGKQ